MGLFVAQPSTLSLPCVGDGYLDLRAAAQGALEVKEATDERCSFPHGVEHTTHAGTHPLPVQASPSSSTEPRTVSGVIFWYHYPSRPEA